MAAKKEVWKAITIGGRKPSVPYAISDRGRFGVMQDGAVKIKKLSPSAGRFRYNVRLNGRNVALFLSREVAKAFLTKPGPAHALVIHKDHNYLNDEVRNLKWATRKEHRRHTALSPQSQLAARRKVVTGSARSKVLDEKEVTAIKKLIWNPKRKLSHRQIADKFGVSEMQIYRLKNGEFWYHVHVPGEPEHPKYKRNLANLSYQKKKEGTAVKRRSNSAQTKKKAGK